MHISELADTGLRTLIFGTYGTGKTRLACSFPQPLYCFDFDNGMRTILKKLESEGGTKLADSKIDFDPYLDSKKKLKRADTGSTLSRKSVLAKIEKSPSAYLDMEDLVYYWVNNGCPYRTIVFDSMTAIGKRFMSYILSVNPEIGRMLGSSNLLDNGIFVRKFGEVVEMTNELADFGVNIIWTAHLQMKDEIRGFQSPGKDRSKDDLKFFGTHETPAIMGKDLPHHIGMYFDEVWKIEVLGSSTTEYQVDTAGPYCKTRSATMPRLMPASWPKLAKELGMQTYPDINTVPDTRITSNE